MTENQAKFKELYIVKVLDGGEMDSEMQKLFDTVLAEFAGNPETMSDFIQSIVDENTVKEPTEIDQLRQENEELKQRIEFNEETMLELADIVLGGGV